METAPLAAATLMALKAQICARCLLRGELFRWYSSRYLSSQCKSFYYCSQACQKEDWSTHKLECKVYQKMAGKNLSVHKQITSEFVLNLRIALLLRNDPVFRKAFLDLVSL